jgi:phage gpG-like protein
MKSGQADEIMQKSFEKNFSSQGRPSWTALKKVTEDDRVKRGFGKKPILTRTGNLRDEVTSMRGKVSVGVGVALMEWGIHDFHVNEAIKFYAHQTGKGRSGQKLPQRKMIGFQEKDRKRIINSLRTWIYSQFK